MLSSLIPSSLPSPLFNLKDPVHINACRVIIIGAGFHICTKLFLFYKEHFTKIIPPHLFANRQVIEPCRNPEGMLARMERAVTLRLNRRDFTPPPLPLRKSGA